MYKGNSNMVAFYMNACIQPKIQLELYEIIINIIYVLFSNMAQNLLYYRHIAINDFFFNILCLNVQNTSFLKASKVNRASRLFIALLKIISHLKKRRSGCFEQRSYPSHPINRFRICCKFFLNAKKEDDTLPSHVAVASK